ncbi:MAG: type II toxin-antitoxin system VapC family toxin, partial [Gemmatimonadota bacterium]|nr:type II toxin-antitoxin system VapC family toxin [Gemmatimonadota bacterium]
MIFDTDVVIWVFRGHEGAAKLVESIDDRQISIVTYMEFIQGARNRQELKKIKDFLTDQAFQTLPLTENIGHRASVYMEEYTLKTALYMADALIAATAIEHHLT